ncbi:MAG: hypothetical protein EHM58_08195 [Ignavibacteriae bacterium]|nr:MAG: hypothetical protein EHM58_08195 [Ignavibacteriota bacterium]
MVNFMTSGQNRKIASQFMGYGDPDSPIWIVAYDPIIEWDDKKINAYKDISYTFDNILLELGKYSKDYFGYREILEEVFPKYEYQKRYFLTSIKPYGIHSNEQRIIESSLFNIKCDVSSDEIFNEIKESRFNALETFFRSYYWKEKYIIFCGGMNDSLIKQHLSDFLKELYYSDRLPYERDEFIGNILADHSRKKFIIPSIKYNDEYDKSQNKGILARLKIETA